jgi:hypothetical protein
MIKHYEKINSDNNLYPEGVVYYCLQRVESNLIKNQAAAFYPGLSVVQAK